MLRWKKAFIALGPQTHKDKTPQSCRLKEELAPHYLLFSLMSNYASQMCSSPTWKAMIFITLAPLSAAIQRLIPSKTSRSVYILLYLNGALMFKQTLSNLPRLPASLILNWRIIPFKVILASLKAFISSLDLNKMALAIHWKRKTRTLSTNSGQRDSSSTIMAF